MLPCGGFFRIADDQLAFCPGNKTVFIENFQFSRMSTGIFRSRNTVPPRYLSSSE
ncbi:MAG: hypothetical protein IKD23_02205 [Lentisphaeria bacterium]|nr:hypothetical protein [Lentisphaeria bacterium]